MKICPVGADFFHGVGQMSRWTDGSTNKHDEAIHIKSKDSEVKTQLVLWIFILFKVAR
jgi:hypothetical protein